MKPWVICFCASNGAGKTTQAEALRDTLLAFGQRARAIDTFNDLIKPEIYPRDGVLKDYVYRTNTLDEEFRTTAERELAINKSGDFNTPSWIALLVCGALRGALSEGAWPIFSGSPRTVFEAEEFIAELSQASDDGLVGGLVVVRLSTPLNVAQARILSRAEALSPDEQERERFKVEKMPHRFKWFEEHTLPAFDCLEEPMEYPIVTVPIDDDGSRTIAALEAEIWREIRKHTRL